jgi:hypothetical protein
MSAGDEELCVEALKLYEALLSDVGGECKAFHKGERDPATDKLVRFP